MNDIDADFIRAVKAEDVPFPRNDPEHWTLRWQRNTGNVPDGEKLTDKYVKGGNNDRLRKYVKVTMKRARNPQSMLCAALAAGVPGHMEAEARHTPRIRVSSAPLIDVCYFGRSNKFRVFARYQDEEFRTDFKSIDELVAYTRALVE